MHQLADAADVVPAQRLDGGQHPGVLGDDVAGAPEHQRVEGGFGGQQRVELQVTQGPHAEMGGRRLALRPAGVVFAADQAAPDPGVDDHHPQPGGDRHGLGFQAAAVDQQGVATLAQRRDELVHDAATAAGELVLGLLAEQGDVAQAGVESVEGLQGLAHGHLQRGRGAETGSLRHVAADHHLEAVRQHAVALDEDIDDAADIVGPVAVAVRRAMAGRKAVFFQAVVGGQHADDVVTARGDGDLGGEADGAGQHETVVVVGVFADQVDAARGTDDVADLAAQVLLQQCGGVLDRAHHGASR